MKNSIFILISVLLLSRTVFATNLSVKNVNSVKYTVVAVYAENVKGVKLVLQRNTVAPDCNKLSLSADLKLKNGEGKGFYDTYIVDQSIMTTLMGCARNPHNVQLNSQPMYIDALTNENLNGVVDVEILVPSQFKLIVSEVLKSKAK
jgi:serine protease inhibitor ecotin